MTLPEKLVDEVLCRLPVKSLLRFKCVSKGWYSQIESNVFIMKHLKRSLECNIGGGLIIKGAGKTFCLAALDSSSVVQIEEPINSILVNSRFIGACNGLICISNNDDNGVFLFNPATRKYRKIVNSPPEFPTFFSAVDSFMFGFGYDEVNDDCKVVMIADCGSTFRGLTVYSLKTNAWTKIQEIPSNTRFCSNRGIFASGSLHWMAYKNPSNCKKFIVAFDLHFQEFKVVPFPPIMRTVIDFNFKCLVVVGGCLCLTDNYPKLSMDVWLMKNYGDHVWYKAVTVEQRGTLGSFGSFNPITFSKSQSDVLLLEVDREKLVWYDLHNKTVKEVEIRGIPIEFNSFLYIESLLNITEDKRRDDFLSKGFKLNL